MIFVYLNWLEENLLAAKDQKFAFDAVFGPNSSNEDVFENTTKDLMDVTIVGEDQVISKRPSLTCLEHA